MFETYSTFTLVPVNHRILLFSLTFRLLIAKTVNVCLVIFEIYKKSSRGLVGGGSNSRLEDLGGGAAVGPDVIGRFL